MASLNDWIIQSTNNSLGGENIDLSGGDYATYSSDLYAKEGKRITDLILGASGKYQNWDAYSKASELSTVSGIDIQPSFQSGGQVSFYSNDPDYRQDNSAIGRKSGYQVQSASNFYSEKYGTNFNESQIESALTGRYGEIQNAIPMGKGWMDLYHTYNKWEQEDEMFRTEMLGLQDELFPAAQSRQKALMASGGMKTGSAQWKSSLSGIADRRLDVEAEVAERKSALEDTSIYKTLKKQYEEMRGIGEMRGVQKTETRYRDVSSWVDETSKYTSPRYGHDSETGTQYEISPGYWTDIPGHYEVSPKAYEHNYVQGTETGKLLYGTGEGKVTGPTFNEFYQSQFGQTSGVANPYENAGSISNQPLSDEDKRARMSAGGADMGEI